MTQVKFGSRLRLGMIVPSVNTEAEPQIEAMLPDGVTLHTTRLKMIEDYARAVAEQPDRADRGRRLASRRCRGRSHPLPLHRGDDVDPDSADRIGARIVAATGLPATVTAHAVRAALAALGAKSVVLVAPYVQEVNDREAAFLAANNVRVLRNHALGLTYAKDFRAIAPEDWRLLAAGQRDDEADAYFLSCAQIRVAEIIAPLDASSAARW